MLDDFKEGWHYYLTVLETDLIEQKLMKILDSLTFKYSRQPQYLRVVPDRMEQEHLRINEKISLVLEEGLKNSKEHEDVRFYQELNDNLINPDRERQLSTKIKSIIQTLNHKVLTKTLQEKLREQGGTNIAQLLKDSEEAKKHGPESVYSIFSEVAVAGFEAIGRRPKYHLIANVLWILDFELRKVDRKPSLFLGNRPSTT
jgi:hypothetical protein